MLLILARTKPNRMTQDDWPKNPQISSTVKNGGKLQTTPKVLHLYSCIRDKETSLSGENFSLVTNM